MTNRKYHWAIQVVPSMHPHAWRAHAGGYYAQACGRRKKSAVGYPAERFVAKSQRNPDWYCSDCARAARLALAKESAPKPEPLAPVVSWPEPRPIADFPIDRPVPVFVPSLGWAIGTALGVCWDAASKKHVATSIVTTDGTVVSPTHFLPIVLPLPPSPEVR